MTNQKRFTAIEILLVIVILGITVSIWNSDDFAAASPTRNDESARLRSDKPRDYPDFRQVGCRVPTCLGISGQTHGRFTTLMNCDDRNCNARHRFRLRADLRGITADFFHSRHDHHTDCHPADGRV